MALPHRKNVTPVRRFFVPLAAAGMVAASVPAAAQTPAEFYKGRTVTIMLGHPPGGSYHMYATLAANHLKRHIPGQPNVVIEHRLGGGGVRAVRHFYSNSPRDGSVLGLFAEAIAHTELLQPDVGQWRTLDMTYIGSFSGVGAVLMRRENAPAKTIAEMRNIQSSVGCTGKTTQSYQAPALMKNLGGFNFRIVCGYPGSAEFVLAMQRGEVDMVSSVCARRTPICDGGCWPPSPSVSRILPKDMQIFAADHPASLACTNGRLRQHGLSRERRRGQPPDTPPTFHMRRLKLQGVPSPMFWVVIIGDYRGLGLDA